MAPLRCWLSDGQCTNILSQFAADDDCNRQSTNNRHLQQSIRASDVSGRRGVPKQTGKDNRREYPRAPCRRQPAIGPVHTMLEHRGELYAGEKPAEPILPGALKIRLASPLLGD